MQRIRKRGAIVATLVLVEAASGSLNRYETGGSKVRRTHGCTYGQQVTFTPKVVEEFRIWPSPEFAVDPPPRPTGPPSGVGTIQRAA